MDTTGVSERSREHEPMIYVTGTETENSQEKQYTDLPGIIVYAWNPPQLEIADASITGASNVISSPNPTPSPVMVGQEIQPEATVAGGTVVVSASSPMKWTFGDDVNGTTMVGGYNAVACNDRKLFAGAVRIAGSTCKLNLRLSDLLYQERRAHD